MNWDFIKVPFNKAAQGDYEQLSYMAAVAGIAAIVPIVWGGLSAVFNYKKMRLAQEEENRIELEENRLQREQNLIELQRQYGELNARWTTDVQKILIDRPELREHNHLIGDPVTAETQRLLYETVVSIFEQAFIQFYRPDDSEYDRWWNTWKDTIVDYLGKLNFRNQLDQLLEGEDAEFVKYIREEAKKISIAGDVLGQMLLEFGR